jgi:hypothetical protein
MEIKKGIMLYNDGSIGNDDILINSGVLPIDKVEVPRVEYENHSFTPSFEADAFLPKRNWRPLETRETQLLKPSGKRTDANTVYVGDIPEHLRRLFETLKLNECRNREDVFARFRNAAATTAEINTAITAFLQPRSEGKPFHFHYLGTNLPNLELVATDTTRLPKGFQEEDKIYMGIHNDGTKYVALSQLYRSGNRFTINLGKEARSFLFVNLTLQQAFNMLKQKIDVKKHRIDIINISKYFFNYFPDYPVIKVTQQPYQYYIAPTDNCLHDGSTLGTKELDIIMVYFGFFKF